MADNILEIKDLEVAFDTDQGQLTAVDGVSFDVPRGKTLGLVGESGCGKTVTALSVMRLLPQPMGKILGGEVRFEGRDLARLSPGEMASIRGQQIGMIFQEPMTALNPVHKIGKQLSEVYRVHLDISRRDAWNRSIEMLAKVGIPAPETRVHEYPHQLSGGMRQRVVIAMALALRPSLVIADEPTTALDVTIQAQILDLLKHLQDEMRMSVILITHNLGVIAETCDEVAVMYAGRLVEKAPRRELFHAPLHAYTQDLLKSIPRLDNPRKTRLATIEGIVPSLAELKDGCRFAPRSGRPYTEEDLNVRPPWVELRPGHWVEASPVCVDGVTGVPQPAGGEL